MKADILNQKGEVLKQVTLNDSVFDVEVNQNIISQYIYCYLANQRESNAHTKDRSEVSGGGKKPWRQKGTGRARFGSSRVPIWRKGGVAFGPRNDTNWKKQMTKKFKKAALRHTLSSLFDNKNIVLVDNVDISKGDKLTKNAVDIQSKLTGGEKKVTVITSEVKSDLIKAFNNVETGRVIYVNDLNVYDLITGGVIVVEEKALEYITNKFAK
jgi:large subunit ribosomal protein L4